jgi:hypothetical protein
MCCKATKESTLWLKKLMEKNGGKMTFWKMIRTNCRSYYLMEYVWEMGTQVNSGLRKPNWNRQKDSLIYSGFHVYLNKNKAISDVIAFRKDEGVSLLEVECDVKDLLGAEAFFQHTAVFKKVVVTDKGWKKFLKTTNAYMRSHR